MPKVLLLDYWSTIALNKFSKETLSRGDKIAYDFVKRKGYSVTYEEFCRRREQGYFAYINTYDKDIELTPEAVFKEFMFKGLGFSEEELGEIARIYHLYDHDVEFRIGCDNVLHKVKDRGFKIGIVSNAWLRYCPDELKAANLSNYFDTIIMSCDVGFRKPNKIIFETAARNLGVALADCIFVGDNHITDIDGSCRAGVAYAIGIEPFSNFSETLIKPVAIVKSMEDILSFIPKKADA